LIQDFDLISTGGRDFAQSVARKLSDLSIFHCVFAVFVERIAQGAYNPEAVQTEPAQIKNFIGGEFLEPVRFLVIPSEAEESLDLSGYSLL
jgi:hypothetical protein